MSVPLFLSPQPFRPATSAAAGLMGLVPTPAIGQQTFILRGDATWVSAAAVALPDQAGASGKILSSDGVNALWSNSVGPITSTAFTGPIGSTTASSGAFTALSATDQLTSTVADGTAPFVVTSTTKVVNLNASSLDGKTFAEPGTIGGTTAGEAFFSQVTAASTVAAAITKTPVAYATGGNITIRFDLGSYGQIDLTTNAVFVSSSGMVRGRTQILDLTNPSGGAFTLSWPGAWKLLNGALPTSIAAGQSIRVELNCGGTTEASIIAGYSLSGFVAGVLASASGGTGVNNGSSTLTFAGNVTHAGAYTQTFTATANTALTLPTTGTLATLAGSEALSNKAITLSSFSGTTGAFTTLTATSLNKVAITAPATGATLTIAEGATLTASATATVSGTNTGDQTISISGDVTAAGSTGALTSQVTKINGTSLAGLATGILKNTTATGVPSIAVAGDFPTLNQNTTGNAGTATELQTTRTIGGSNFNGGANVTSFPAPGAIGGTTPSTGAFTSVTTLSDSGYQAVVGQLTTGDRVGISGQASGSGTALVFFDNAQTTFRPAIFDASSHSFKISGVATTSITSTGLQGAIGASSPSTGAFTSLSSSSTTTLNGTTIPASKTLVVTTDKLSALAATTSAELAGVISDETGSGALVFATSPTLVTPALGAATATSLTVNDNTTLGSSNSDTVNFNARVASNINPSTDDTYDLGVTGHEWRNLNIDGTANIDSLVADTADINGGTIDGTAIGATTPSTVVGTTIGGTRLSASGDYLTNGGDLTLTNTNGGRSWRIGDGIAGVTSSLVIFDATGSAIVGKFTSTGLNSTAIGATTPSTGAFTTLSSTGTFTSGAAISANYSNPRIEWFDTSAGTDAKRWDILSGGGVQSFRLVNDANGAANTWLQCNRAGFASATIAITGNTSVTGTLSSTGILSGPGFRASKTTATSGLVKIQDEGANVYNVIGSRNNADSAALPLVFQGSNFDFAGAVAVTGALSSTTGATFATSSGSLLVGISSAPEAYPTKIAFKGSLGGAGIYSFNESIGADAAFLAKVSNTACNLVYFDYSGTKVGSITTNGTATSYNTSSDYRRKSNVKDLTGSGAFIDALKPRTFDWDTGDKGVGFIAHEFAEVSPSSVTGKKDAVDSDGKPVYQGMQASSAEVIANLVAELQSVRARLAALESK